MMGSTLSVRPFRLGGRIYVLYVFLIDHTKIRTIMYLYFRVYKLSLFI